MENLRPIVRELKVQRDRAQQQLDQLNSALAALEGSGVLKQFRSQRKPRLLSVAARQRIAAAQRARWAKWKAARKKK